MFTRRRDDTTTTTTTSAPTTTQLFGRPVQNSIRPPQQQRHTVNNTNNGNITRQQHLDSYINNPQLAPSTRKISDDDSTFDTVFQSVTGDTLILRVHWPMTSSGMIVRPPAMTLAGVDARHPWLDSRMRITGYDPIQSAESWNTAQIHLGVAVHTVIQHLQLNPPTIVRFVDSGLSAIQTNNTKKVPQQQQQQSPPPPPAYHDSMVNSNNNKSMNAQQQQQRNPTRTTNIPNIDWPTIPSHFTELDTLSRERLEELIQNELEFRTFAKNKLDIIQQYNTIQQQQLYKNVSVATSNLQYETELQALYTNITNMQTELQTTVHEFQVVHEIQQNQLLQPPPTTKIISQLNLAKKEADLQSEAIAEQWLKRQQQSSTATTTSSTIPTFIDEFMVVRKLQHVRAAKLELLQRNSTTSNGSSGSGSNNYYSSNGNGNHNNQYMTL